MYFDESEPAVFFDRDPTQPRLAFKTGWFYLLSLSIGLPPRPGHQIAGRSGDEPGQHRGNQTGVRVLQYSVSYHRPCLHNQGFLFRTTQRVLVPKVVSGNLPKESDKLNKSLTTLLGPMGTVVDIHTVTPMVVVVVIKDPTMECILVCVPTTRTDPTTHPSVSAVGRKHPNGAAPGEDVCIRLHPKTATMGLTRCQRCDG